MTDVTDVKVINFIDSAISKTLLFECAKYWASEGFHVNYITNYVQENLPPCVQGINNDTETFAEFMKITFLTTPHTSDLIEFLINLRTSAQVPKVLVLENITKYENLSSKSSESNFLLMCALLKSSAYLCSEILNDTIYVIISTEYKIEHFNIMNLILRPTKIWRTYKNSEDNMKNFTLREFSLNPTCDVTKELHFTLLEKDEHVLRLNNIIELLHESCN